MNTPVLSYRQWGLVMAALGTGLFSLKSIFIKLAYGYGIDPLSLITLRMGFSFPFYAVVLLVVWRGPGRKMLDARLLFTIGLLGLTGYYFCSYLDLMGLQYVTAQFERLLLFSYPTFVVLIQWFFLREQPTRNIFQALGATYAGIVVIFAHDLHHLGSQVAKGVGLIMLCALLFAVYMVVSKKVVRRIGSVLFTSLAMLVSCAAVSVHYVWVYPANALLGFPAPVYGLAAGMAFLSTVIPSFLMLEAVKRIGPDYTSIMGSLGPVITTGLAIVILGESFHYVHALGMILVLLGIHLLIKRRGG